MVPGARRLVSAAAVPKLAWGRAVQGTSPTQLRKIRAVTARTLGIRKPGGCCTVAYECSVGRCLDPAFQYPLEQIMELLRVWASTPMVRQGAALGLMHAASRVVSAGERRWQQVTGPMTAILATLGDLGWKFVGGDHGQRWRDPSEALWDLDPAEPAMLGQLHARMVDSLEQHRWQLASRHWQGRGIEKCVDMTSMRRSLPPCSLGLRGVHCLSTLRSRRRRRLPLDLGLQEMRAGVCSESHTRHQEIVPFGTHISLCGLSSIELCCTVLSALSLAARSICTMLRV